MKTSRLLLPLLFMLAGCGIPLSEKAIEETPEGVYVKQLVKWNAARDYASLEAALVPAAKGPGLRAAMEQAAQAVPVEAPASIRFVSWNFSQTTGQDRHVYLAAEYEYGPDRWLLVTANVVGKPGSFQLWNFRVQPMNQSLEEFNRFTLAGKSWLHFFMLAATALALGTSLYALVLCVRTAGLRRKWLWVLFILCGFGAFSLNWTTGTLKFGLLQSYVLSAACLRSGFAGPWILSFAIPVGAIIFLAKRKKKAANPAAVVPPGPNVS